MIEEMAKVRYDMVCNSMKGVPKLVGDKIHWLSVHLVDHCNLNCARCGHFAPIAKKVFPSKEQILSDLKRMSELTKEKPIDDVSLKGGEPLLSPDIVEYMNKVREFFPNASITLQTNGLLIPKMSDEFFDSVKRNNVKINVSLYFEQDFYKDIIAKIKEKGCEEQFFFDGDSRFGCVLFYATQLCHKTNHTSEEAWSLCPSANVCAELRNGRIYSCPVLAYGYMVNDYFNENFEFFEDDSIDIYNHSLEEIVEHMKKYKKFCKNCTDDSLKKLYFPYRSKCARCEWLKDIKE